MLHPNPRTPGRLQSYGQDSGRLRESRDRAYATGTGRLGTLFIGLIENALGTGHVENRYITSTLACSMRELPPMPGP